MSESGLSDDIVEEIVDGLKGSCSTVTSVMERVLDEYGMDPANYDQELVESDLSTWGIECCEGCGWWMECCELSCEHDVCGFCEDCRKDGECQECMNGE